MLVSFKGKFRWDTSNFAGHGEPTDIHGYDDGCSPQASWPSVYLLDPTGHEVLCPIGVGVEGHFELRPSSSRNDSVRSSVCFVTPFWQCSCHRIIMKFSGVITTDKSDVHAEFQGQRSKVRVTIYPFLDCISGSNSHMTMKWCTKPDAAEERCPIVFQGHPSNFEVTWDKKLPILTWIRHSRAVTPVWIHGWLWNDVQRS